MDVTPEQQEIKGVNLLDLRDEQCSEVWAQPEGCVSHLGLVALLVGAWAMARCRLEWRADVLRQGNHRFQSH